MADRRGTLTVAYSRPEVPDPPEGLRAVNPGEWIQVWRRVRGVSFTVKGTGFALASFADWNDGTRIRPGNVILGNVCSEMGPKTMERALVVIRDHGLIWRYVEARREGVKNVHDEYRLTIPVDILARIPLLTPDLKIPGLPALYHGTLESCGCGQTADLATRNLWTTGSSTRVA